MFLNVLHAQQSKTLRSGVFRVEVALLAGVTALMVVLTNVISEMRSDAPVTLAGQLRDMLQQTGTSSIGHMLAVVLAGALMAHEYSRRSVHLWLSRGVSRSAFLWAKFVSFLVPIALFLLVTAAVTVPISSAFTIAEHGTVGPLAGELAGLAKTAALGAFALVPYAALALLLAVAGRSTLFAVGGSLAFTLLAETILWQILGLIGGRAADALVYLPWGLASGLMGVQMGELPLLSPGAAAGVIALYIVALLAAATLLFRRQDLSA